jgi:hypothetical protein
MNDKVKYQISKWNKSFDFGEECELKTNIKLLKLCQQSTKVL